MPLQSAGYAVPLRSASVGLRTQQLIRIQKLFAAGETGTEFVIATPVAAAVDQCHAGNETMLRDTTSVARWAFQARTMLVSWT